MQVPRRMSSLPLSPSASPLAASSRHGTRTHQGDVRVNRSSTLRSVGCIATQEHPSTPTSPSRSFSAAGSFPAALVTGGMPNTSMFQTDNSAADDIASKSPPLEDSNLGLTPASLKHVRRQRDKMEEERNRVQADLNIAVVQLKEQRELNSELSAKVTQLEARLAVLSRELEEARTREAEQRERADRLELRANRAEECLAAKEIEVSSLRQACEDQRLLTKDVCEAIGMVRSREGCTVSRERELEERVKCLTREQVALEQKVSDQAAEHRAMMLKAATAISAAEKAMELARGFESLRAAKIADAINQKVELHISVPRLTLSYNNAPPVLISIARGLGEDRILDFLSQEVFPHFEPLWICADGFGGAPDGHSKQMYSTRMLERLAAAVKVLIGKCQQDNPEQSADWKLTT